MSIEDHELSPLSRLYRRSRLRHFVRRRRDAAFYHLARVALVPPRAVSLQRALAIADRTADMIYPTLPGVRRVVLDNLAIAFGDTLSATAREEIARAAYRNTARCFVELAKIDDILPSFDTYISVAGWEHMEVFRAVDRGAIVVTGHIGNYELLAAYVARAGIPLAASARRIPDPRLDKLLNDFRTGNGMHVIRRNSPNSGSQILKALKHHAVLALQIDQDTRVPSVSVPFFGRLARTPVSPALLSIRRQIPVVPAFAQRRPQGGHHFTFMPPIYPPKMSNLRRDVVELTRQFSQILEDHIRRHPSEWIWWHRRWRRGPVPRLDLDVDSERLRRASP